VSPTRKALLVAVVATFATLAVVVVATRGPDDSSAATDTSVPSSNVTTAPVVVDTTATTTAAPESGGSTTLPPVEEGGANGPTNIEGNSIMVPVRNLPLDVGVDDTSGLSDGDTVTVQVTAKSGSKIYGADVRLCRGDAVIENTADFAPTQGGQCIAAPLSAGSDAFVELAGSDPFTSLDIPFRVGTGTSTYQMQDGTPVAITCGPGHPCTLVVKLQIPDGFGFRSFDLTFG
jgi:hypothetical protein